MSTNFTLHLGDCLDPVTGMASLPDKSVDVVITDPPYEAEAHTTARRQARGPDGIAEEYSIDFAAITEPQRRAVADEAVRLTRGWVLCFCQIEAVGLWRTALEAAGAKWRRGGVWVKPDGTPQFTGDRPAQGFECLAMAWAGEGRSRWNGGGRRACYEYNVNNFGREGGALSRQHPTQKPLALMQALVRDFSDPGELILDPFAGSGTTGVAALSLGRRFIGWEQNAEWYAGAVRRIANTHEQPELFGRKKQPKPKQDALAFGGEK